MPLNELVTTSRPARDDVQQTDFGYDVVPRYVCNNWQEIAAAQAPGAYPFDAVVIGAGMFGGYYAEKLYRFGGGAALRILLLDAGAFLLQSHIQSSSAAGSAARAICAPATMPAARKTLSGGCPGSATRPFRALPIMSAAGRCSGAAGRRR
jgi:hypothetical protein